MTAPPHKAFRASRTRPSRPLAQTVSVIADLFGSIRRRPESALPATDCAVPPASASLRPAPIRRSVPVREYRCTPHQSQCVAHSFGPSRPRPVRPSSHPRCRSPSAAWSLRSPARCPAGARHPSRTRPPPRPRSTSFRALGHWETCRRLPHPGQRERQRHLPHRPSRLQDSQQPRPTRDTRPGVSATSTDITRPKAGRTV